MRALAPKIRCILLVRMHQAARAIEAVLHGPRYVRDRQLGRLDDCPGDAEQGSRVVSLV